MNITKKISVLLLVASIAGIVISFSLLREDVLSTKHTLTTYFPQEFGVTPAATESGGELLGWFVTITQIVAVGVAFSPAFRKPLRITAGLVLALATPFDAWTDIVFRSGYLTGDLIVASVTTIAFYTFGSEVMQSLSWVLLLSIWRQALADSMWGVAYTWNSLKTLRAEWDSFLSAARNQAAREAQLRAAARGVGYSASRPAQYNQPVYRPAPKAPAYRAPAQEPSYHPVDYLGNEEDD